MTLALDRRADLWGDRTAVVDPATDRELSYAELDRRAEDAAGRLAAAGVDEGDAVVVLARNRPAWLALLFGARRRGATLAPVSHRLPAETVGECCERTDPALALCEPRFEDLLADAPVDAETLAAFETRDPAGVGAVDDPTATPRLYLHTGGTTGVPKVVVVEERQVEWNCVTEAAAWGLGKETVAPVLLPLFHTGGWHLLALPTLYVGGRVVLQREFDPEAALALIEEYGATQVFGVAAIFRAMAETGAFEDADFGTVEWFMSGGGPTPEAVAEPYRERGQRFVQGYGLTEGGPNNLYFEPGRNDLKHDSVGRPFPDCEARIVGDDGDSLPAGETGELELRGPVTAERYLETEDGTFEGPWVSTGDLARRDDEGDYYIVGRTDNMFVSGGENVYPERIEDVLSDRPDVAAIGVVGVAHEQWDTVPKAVVVGETDAETLRSYAEERLADHEVPTEFAFVDSLPESGPGKLDRAELERRYGE
ncbi:long-chain fatty acid--CoA ligase [Halobacteriales archaeon QS_1_67_19]|nr:MAG: long-chain fatty acid--CoA ligase [Halobacteriales archaeon QS_1_67_19]